VIFPSCGAGAQSLVKLRSRSNRCAVGGEHVCSQSRDELAVDQIIHFHYENSHHRCAIVRGACVVSLE